MIRKENNYPKILMFLLTRREATKTVGGGWEKYIGENTRKLLYRFNADHQCMRGLPFSGRPSSYFEDLLSFLIHGDPF